MVSWVRKAAIRSWVSGGIARELVCGFFEPGARPSWPSSACRLSSWYTQVLETLNALAVAATDCFFSRTVSTISEFFDMFVSVNYVSGHLVEGF